MSGFFVKNVGFVGISTHSSFIRAHRDTSRPFLEACCPFPGNVAVQQHTPRSTRVHVNSQTSEEVFEAASLKLDHQGSWGGKPRSPPAPRSPHCGSGVYLSH